MQLIKIREQQVKDKIYDECASRGMSKSLATETANYAEYLLKEHHLLLGTAFDKALQIAIARQSMLGDHNKNQLRIAVGAH